MSGSKSCLCLDHRQSRHFFQNLNTQNLESLSRYFSASAIAKALIIFYQATFAFFLGGNCRYYPSCSHYALESFEKHGFFYAFYLTIKRLFSCHPFSKKAFYDPVPPKLAEKRVL